MKIKKVNELNKINEDFTNSSAMDIINEIEEITNYFSDDDKDELLRKMYKISDLITDLRFQCE